MCARPSTAHLAHWTSAWLVRAGLFLVAAHAGFVRPASASDHDVIAQTLERVQSIRAVKDLQAAFAQDVEAGRWDSAAKLIANSGVVDWGDGKPIAANHVARDLRARFGKGTDGIRPGYVHVPILLAPVVTLSPDGRSAKGRWHEVMMVGHLGGDADWSGGIYENEYVRTDRGWKIARLNYHPQFRGPYDGGWRNAYPDQAIVPYHYTSDAVGKPAALHSSTATPPAGLSNAAVAAQVASLTDADAVANLQNAYGFYVDRKMWDDVADLFDDGGVLQFGGNESAQGRVAIRKALERAGPAGLAAGELNEHLQADMRVCVSADGSRARARGFDFGMTGQNEGKAYWSVDLFDNTYVKRGGIWTIETMRIVPRMRTDYALGWAKSDLVERSDELAVPAFQCANSTPVRAEARSAQEVSLALSKLAARDAFENISSAFGNYIDDFQWDDLGKLFARGGRRESPQLGFYVGPERITQLQMARYGPFSSPRTFVAIHTRTQPVVHFSPDGRSAKVRTRLFQFNSSLDRAGTIISGIYEDQYVLEDGSWKFSEVEIDHTLQTADYAHGWTGMSPGMDGRMMRMATEVLRRFPPDSPNVGEVLPPYPALGLMWFHYVNPVSGRAPPFMTPKTAAVASNSPTR